jgi:hypothetical protein
MYPIVREEMWAAVSRATGARPSLCGSMSSNVETLEIGSKIYIYLNAEKENVRSRRSITSVLCGSSMSMSNNVETLEISEKR